jgi:heme/copper-type cytochrome/quinol oxidase subunit 1
MQVVAILILGAIGLIVVASVLHFIIDELSQHFWQVVAAICMIVAVPTGILTFLCLILYALGGGSPELTKGFVPCVILFVTSFLSILLIGAKTDK